MLILKQSVLINIVTIIDLIAISGARQNYQIAQRQLFSDIVFIYGCQNYVNKFQNRFSNRPRIHVITEY